MMSNQLTKINIKNLKMNEMIVILNEMMLNEMIVNEMMLNQMKFI